MIAINALFGRLYSTESKTPDQTSTPTQPKVYSSLPSFLQDFKKLGDNPDQEKLTTFVITSLKNVDCWNSWLQGDMLKYSLRRGLKRSDKLFNFILDIKEISFISPLLQHNALSQAQKDRLTALSNQASCDGYDESRLVGFAKEATRLVGHYEYWDNAIFGSDKQVDSGEVDSKEDYGTIQPKITSDVDTSALNAIIEKVMLSDDQKTCSRLVEFFKENSQLSLKSTTGLRLAIQKQDQEALNIFIQRTNLKFLIGTDDALLMPEEQTGPLFQFARNGGIDKTPLTEEELQTKFPKNSAANKTRKAIIKT